MISSAQSQQAVVFEPNGLISLCHELKATLMAGLELEIDAAPVLANRHPKQLRSGFSASDLYIASEKWFPGTPSLFASPSETITTVSAAEASRLATLMARNKLDGIESRTMVEKPLSKSSSRKADREHRSKTAGAGWFDLPRQKPNEELRQELQVLRLRSFADPKRFYKKADRALPEHFEVGRVVSSAADYYSADWSGKGKKGNQLGFVEELLADHHYRKYAKRKYSEIQEKRAALGGRRRKRVKL